MNEKISVIVPVYKVEEYLDKCVESIVNQSYKNLEIILVDDGSPDNCPQMCDAWAKRDKRIRVIHKQNGGLSDARNAGLEIATGEFIGFIDSDDYVLPNMYEALYKALKDNDADISMCSFKQLDIDGKEREKSKNIVYTKNEVLDRGAAINKLFDPVYAAYVIAWNKLYKRQIFENIRYPIGRIHEDEFVAHHILGASKKTVCIEDKLYMYLRRGISIMGVKRDVRHLDTGLAMIDRYYFLKEKYPQFSKKQSEKVYGQALTAVRSEGYSNLAKDYKDMVKTAIKILYKEKNLRLLKLILALLVKI